MMAVQDTHDTQNKWETGIFCCCCSPGQSGNQCCFFCGTLFCQPCAQGILQEHAGLADDCCGPCCFYSLSSYFTAMLVPCISLFYLRRSLAEKADIGEGCLSAFCKVLCCFPCAMSQMNSQFILGNQKFETQGSGCCKCMQFLMGCVGEAKFVTAIRDTSNDRGADVLAPSTLNTIQKVRSFQPQPRQPLPNNLRRVQTFPTAMQRQSVLPRPV
jgi:hypothetical protein